MLKETHAPTSHKSGDIRYAFKREKEEKRNQREKEEKRDAIIPRVCQKQMNYTSRSQIVSHLSSSFPQMEKKEKRGITI